MSVVGGSGLSSCSSAGDLKIYPIEMSVLSIKLSLKPGKEFSISKLLVHSRGMF